jgi:type I restriction enzyme M protein
MALGTTIKAIQDIMRKDTGVDGDAQRIGQLVWMLFLKILDDREVEKEDTRKRYRSPIPDALRWKSWAADPEGITGDELLAFVNGTLFPGLRGLKGTDPLSGVVRGVFDQDAINFMKSGQLLRQVVNKLNEIDLNRSDDRHQIGAIYEQILSDLRSAGNAGEYTPRGVTAFMVERIDPSSASASSTRPAAPAASWPRPSSTSATGTGRRTPTSRPSRPPSRASRRSRCRTCSA